MDFEKRSGFPGDLGHVGEKGVIAEPVDQDHQNFSPLQGELRVVGPGGFFRKRRAVVIEAFEGLHCEAGKADSASEK